MFSATTNFGLGFPKKVLSESVIFPSWLTSAYLKRPGAASGWVGDLDTSLASWNSPTTLYPKNSPTGCPGCRREKAPKRVGPALIFSWYFTPSARLITLFVYVLKVPVMSNFNSWLTAAPCQVTEASTPLFSTFPVLKKAAVALPPVAAIGELNNSPLTDFLYHSTEKSNLFLMIDPSTPIFSTLSRSHCPAALPFWLA